MCGQQDLKEDKESITAISLHVIAGTPNPRTMRLLGRIGKSEVVILVNTGSTHNFLDLIIVARNQLLIQHTKKITIKVANGDSMLCEEQCEQIPYRVQDSFFSTDFYAMTLGAMM